MRNVLILLSLGVALSGCAPRSAENNSIEVEVFPINYQMALVVDKKHKAETRREWDKFYSKYETELLNKKVSLFYSSSIGKQVAYQWKDKLVDDGAVRNNISIKSNADLDNFDVKIQISKHKVVTPFCQPQEVSEFGHRPLGCASNSNLWQSIVYPEDALLPTSSD